MTEAADIGARSGHFRKAITDFIEARRDAKLKDKDDDPGSASKYDTATWLADAARRVSQIQAVTHVLKATHPDARGSSLHVAPDRLPKRPEIGSHLLGERFAEDVVGNAAALDVFKFLKIEVENKRLLDWMASGDTDLHAALSSDAGLAQQWMASFASLVRADERPTSHTMAKQVYWLVGEEPQDDAQYHLLQPMFSSTLAHVVHADIQDARFGEVNKQARQAFRSRDPSEATYRDYRNLVVRKLGGTKPQNISQLNSERGGVNYLMPSLPPPAWAPDEHANLLKRKSALDAFLWFEDVRVQVRELGQYLQSVKDEPGTMEVRNQRDALTKALVEQLAMYGAAVRARHPPGWTRDDACQLPDCEQLWLDPERRELLVRQDPERPDWTTEDLAFQHDYDRGDWADDVAERFGLWLNQHLRDAGLVMMAAPELRSWARQAVIDVAWPVPMQRRARGGAA